MAPITKTYTPDSAVLYVQGRRRTVDFDDRGGRVAVLTDDEHREVFDGAAVYVTGAPAAPHVVASIIEHELDCEEPHNDIDCTVATVVAALHEHDMDDEAVEFVTAAKQLLNPWDVHRLARRAVTVK